MERYMVWHTAYKAITCAAGAYEDKKLDENGEIRRQSSWYGADCHGVGVVYSGQRAFTIASVSLVMEASAHDWEFSCA